MKQLFIDRFHPSALLTYLGVVLATAGITAIYFGQGHLAVACLFCAGWCDLFDGKFARSFKRDEQDKRFGIAIDSLADVLSFAVLPCCIFLSLQPPWYLWVIPVAYVLCALTRLAVFDAEAQVGVTVTHYRGLPSTFAALIFPLVWLLSFVLDPTVFLWVYACALAVTAGLFVLNIRVKKP
jgi:CDP-diacylglycerol--serine O-phosphatidyltransferase